ncbi:MAG: hypothetical protein CVV47_14025 [Spirochaetae bacterium HGW-Spirochaetae-3]|jgi:hypothetical protein|nr:MAG: hypothetical protein CVV47_14025 [Spirochaetae bacterium HGW-Spirochaetae-3]
MDELLDNLFLLIPLALLLFFRVFAGRLKARAAQRKETAIPKAKGPGQLSRFIGYLTGAPKADDAPLEPLHFEESEARRDDIGKAREKGRPADSPPSTPMPSAIKTPTAKPPATKPPAVESQYGKPVAAFAFPAAIERLPPLKKAVALSEILGTPRSIR